MFQEFGTQNMTHAYSITVLFYYLGLLYMRYFFKMNCFYQALLDISVSCHRYAKIRFFKTES